MSKFTMSPCGKLWYSGEYDDDKTLRAGSREAVVDKALSLVRHDDIMFREKIWVVWWWCGALIWRAFIYLKVRHNPELQNFAKFAGWNRINFATWGLPWANANGMCKTYRYPNMYSG